MNQQLFVYPRFENAAILTDRYWRLVHYLGAASAGIGSIQFSGSLRPASAPPAYLDQTLPAREAAFKRRVVFGDATFDSNAIAIVSDQSHVDDPVIRNHCRVVIDPAALHEGDLGIELGARLQPRTTQQRAAAQQRLLHRIAQARQDVAHVLGTGPSLANLNASALPPGASVVCNSLVKNGALLDQLRPQFLVAVDPIFHAGPSVHAAVFREHLVRTMDRLRPLFVVQERDAHIYEAILPQSLHDLLVPVPVNFGLKPNLDLTRRFSLTATRNVLTMVMLPLAAMLGHDVRIYGCDGRAPDERAMFWSYDSNSAFSKEQGRQVEAHPGFFTLNVGDYYALHCETVRRWIVAMERTGVRVRSETPSYIPALAARSGESVTASQRAVLGLELRGRASYAYRALQSCYGALLADPSAPEWLKRALKGAAQIRRRVL